MEVDEKVEAEKSEIAEMKDSEEEEEEDVVGEAMTDSEAPSYAVSDRTNIRPCIHCISKPMSCLSPDVLTFDTYVQIEHEAKNARDEDLKRQEETQETQEAQSQDAQEAEAAEEDEEDEAAEEDEEDEEAEAAEAEEDVGETQEAPEAPDAPEVPEAHQIVAADSNVRALEYCFIGWRDNTGAAFE